MVPPLLHTAILCHWASYVRRLATTPVWATLYLVANAKEPQI